MDNHTAYTRAMKALRLAAEAQGRAYMEVGGGWGDMSSDEVFAHIKEYIAFEFKQGPKPPDFPTDEAEATP
jgi:hypothetical protein